MKQEQIRGNYLEAALLGQEQRKNTIEFNQGTAENKLADVLDRLEKRLKEVEGGADLTKAEDKKVKEFKKEKGRKAAAGGYISNYMGGGNVSGPGTKTSDSIPAMLSDGEYVIKADSVQKYGVGTFDALNAQRFAKGGKAKKKKTPSGWDLKWMDTAGPKGWKPFDLPPVQDNRVSPRDPNMLLPRPTSEGLLEHEFGTKSWTFDSNASKMPIWDRDRQPNASILLAMGGLVKGYRDGGLGSRPKYGNRSQDKNNWFQRYVLKLTKAQDSSLMGGDPLGVGSILRALAGQSRKGDALSAALFPLSFTGLGPAKGAISKPVPALSKSVLEKIMSKWKPLNSMAPRVQKYDWTNTDPLHGPLFIGRADVGGNETRRSISYRLPKNEFGKGDDLVGLSPMMSSDPKYLIERYMAGDKAVLARMQDEGRKGLNSHPLSIQSLFKSVAKPFRGTLYRGMTSQSVSDTLPKHIVEAIEQARSTGNFSALVGKDFIMRRASFSSDPGIASFFAPGQSTGPMSSLLMEARLFGRKVTPTSEMFPDKKFMAPYGQKSAQRYRSELESLVGGRFVITGFDGSKLLVQQKAKGGLVEEYKKGGLINLPKFHDWNGPVPGSYGQELPAMLKSGTEGIYQEGYINDLKQAASNTTNSSSSVYNVSMNINGADSDPKQIAEEVMKKMQVLTNKNNKMNVGLR
jgi:hypothetical protein